MASSPQRSHKKSRDCQRDERAGQGGPQTPQSDDDRDAGEADEERRQVRLWQVQDDLDQLAKKLVGFDGVTENLRDLRAQHLEAESSNETCQHRS